MNSNVLIDNLFARRPKIHYVCPPICGVQLVPTSSGSPSVSFEPESPLGCVGYRLTEDGFLEWDAFPGALCYNVYMTTFIGPPGIVTQPVGADVVEGDSVLFSVVATDTDPLSYQWKKDGVDIPGATSSSFSISSALLSDAGSYQVTVTNTAGSVTSNAAELTVSSSAPPPSITVQPSSQTVVEGQNVVLSVTATGTAPLSYQWKKNGVDIGGETASTLSFSPVALSDAASYTVVVSNVGGSVISDAAVLTVDEFFIGDSFDTYTVGFEGTMTYAAGVNFNGNWLTEDLRNGGDSFDSYTVEDPLAQTLDAGDGYSAAWIVG